MTTSKKKSEETEIETSVSNDVDALVGDPQEYTLLSGTVVKVHRLKTRELFKLLKVITRGAGPLLSEVDFAPGTDAGVFAGQMIGLIVMAIPEAEDEAIEFIQFMVEPADLKFPERSKDDKQKNEEKYLDLADQMANPELEDTVGIFTTIIQNEAEDILSLGKRIGAMLPKSLSLTNN